MAKQRYFKWFVKLCLILILIAGAPQVVSAILANSLYLPVILKSEPTLTPTPTATPTRTPTPTATKLPSPIVNPSFEQGENGWVFDGEAYVTGKWDHGGDYSAALGDGTNDHFAAIAQQFTVPYNLYNLEWWQNTSTNEICGSVKWDYVIIMIDGVGIQTNNVCRDFNGVDNWVVNLVNYRGRTVVFRMEFNSDDNIPSTVYVDDFEFVP